MKKFAFSVKKWALFGAMALSGVVVAGDGNEKWVQFGDLGASEGLIFVDMTSVKQSGENADWKEVRTLLQNETEKKSAIHAFTIDCKEVKARKDGNDRYDQLWAKGEVVWHEDGDEKDRFRDIKKESSDGKVMFDLYRKVCEK